MKALLKKEGSSMKQYLTAILLGSAALVGGATEFADAALISIPEVFATPGSTATMQVNYDQQISLPVTYNGPLASIEFDLVYNPSILTFSGASAGPVTTAASKTFTITQLFPNTVRFLIAGNSTTIGSGILISPLSFSVSNSAPLGLYNVTIQNLLAWDPDGTPQVLNGTSNPGKVNVVPLPSALLLFGSGLVAVVGWRWKHLRLNTAV
jgi:hypothetical protein